MPETFQMETFCDHCDKDTMHEFYDAGHERDSSCNLETCMVCRWWKSGFSSVQHPPSEGEAP